MGYDDEIIHQGNENITRSIIDMVSWSFHSNIQLIDLCYNESVLVVAFIGMLYPEPVYASDYLTVQ